MISPQVLPSVLTLTLMLLFLAGCTEPQSDSEPAVTTEMHEDFDHHHPHQHGTHHDHEHEHGDGFEGTHSHDHSHGHRHGSPLHGGRVVSIGHSHHKDGETHFHAEVMPVADDLISFHILTEDESGESVDAQVDAKEITGLISVKGDESAGHEVTFRVTADDGEVIRIHSHASRKTRSWPSLFGRDSQSDPCWSATELQLHSFPTKRAGAAKR